MAWNKRAEDHPRPFCLRPVVVIPTADYLADTTGFSKKNLPANSSGLSASGQNPPYPVAGVKQACDDRHFAGQPLEQPIRGFQVRCQHLKMPATR